MDSTDITKDFNWASRAIAALLREVLAACAAEFDPAAWGLG